MENFCVNTELLNSLTGELKQNDIKQENINLLIKEPLYYLWQVCPSENWCCIVAMSRNKHAILKEYDFLINDMRRGKKFNYFVVNKSGTFIYAWKHTEPYLDLMFCMFLQEEYYNKFLKK